MRLCPWSRAFLSLALKGSVLGRAVLGLGFFFVSLASSLVYSPPPLLFILRQNLKNIPQKLLYVTIEILYELTITNCIIIIDVTDFKPKHSNFKVINNHVTRCLQKIVDRGVASFARSEGQNQNQGGKAFSLFLNWIEAKFQ